MNRLEGDQTSLTEFPKQGRIAVFALIELLRKTILFSYSKEVVIIRVSTRIQTILLLSLFMVSGSAQGTVFINEVSINPPGSSNPGSGDDIHKYVVNCKACFCC